MRYVKDTKLLSNTMEKALKRLDKDHIHYMIETEPTMSVSKIVNLIKSYTTYHICGSISGKNIHFGQMVILPVV